jgi:formate hydrogenlyase subunit 4
MGSSREMTISSFAEPALLMALFVVGLKTQSLNLSEMILRSSGTGYLDYFSLPSRLVMVGFFIVVVAETGRIPVDNPATHLELTMVHEAMVLEYSGRWLALLEWAKAVKQFLFFTLMANIFFPVGLASDTRSPEIFYSMGIFFSKVFVLVYIMAWVETLNAKLRLFIVPRLLMVSLCLSMMALVYIAVVR